MKIRIKRLHPNAILPTFGTEQAAAMDLYAVEETTVAPLEPTLIPTGIAIDYPEGSVGILALRSSTPKKRGLFSPHGIGIIDADYRGEHMIQVCALKETVTIQAGERIAQLMIVPARQVNGVHIDGITEVQEISETARIGGFGSTG